jgi:hypothetical protein
MFIITGDVRFSLVRLCVLRSLPFLVTIVYEMTICQLQGATVQSCSRADVKDCHRLWLRGSKDPALLSLDDGVEHH